MAGAVEKVVYVLVGLILASYLIPIGTQLMEEAIPGFMKFPPAVNVVLFVILPLITFVGLMVVAVSGEKKKKR